MNPRPLTCSEVHELLALHAAETERARPDLPLAR
jgi:hypothetical protein